MNALPKSRREMGERLARKMDAETAKVRETFLLREESDRALVEARHRREIMRMKARSAPRWLLDETLRQQQAELAGLPEMQHEREKRMGKTVAIKGRITSSGSTVWDIYHLQGDKQPRLVQSGIPDAGEAVAIGNDLVLGRIRVAFEGVRRCFEQTGSFLAPSKAIDAAGSYRGRARAVKVGDDLIITSK